MSKKDDLLHEIGSLVIRDKEIMSRPWEHLVLVAQVSNNSTQVNGFAYQSGGKAVPTGPDNFEIVDKFEELRTAMGADDIELWNACLFRLDRDSHKLSIDFEYEQPEKWLITPSTVKEMAEKLRPAK